VSGKALGHECSRLTPPSDCTVPAIDISDEDLESAFETNVFSVMRLVRELSPLIIRARGKIVNIGSITAFTPYVFSSIYNATKGALHAYSNTLRLELAPFGVRVILIVTGGVKSRITRTERTLAEESLYLPISAEYLRRVHHSQGKNTNTSSAIPAVCFRDALT
jgi:1-acylglycerone phosphate reductase